MNIWPRVLIGVAIAAALIGLYSIIYDQGAESVRTGIERQNNEAGNSADLARGAYDRCRDRGWVYQFDTGKCVRPTQGRGN
ncbi:hypothetical protein GGQ64_005335 [Rhizobium azooxidifex]|uniref:Uncharacterized protein n=1 Tax=Mycoplana azooxidifex TaxID=1636188 RepID=A0A7W6GMB1_9HYPH|nr:hypothetical protein [Mycoplana azooxidifex]MBB3980088.1 hypothetical protein [Mycoplana azooxidifex]